mmetsp:Transcript_30033/g.29287  ORF Transcript_30033/g.29287 Transcript_30033/m.29287 type:complete len:82 (-) Transcript_30033:2811-3056(-)
MFASQGGVFYVIDTTMYDYGSKFIHNSGILGGGISCAKSDLELEFTIFEENYALYGGAFYIESESSLLLSNAEFRSNAAYT